MNRNNVAADLIRSCVRNQIGVEPVAKPAAPILDSVVLDETDEMPLPDYLSEDMKLKAAAAVQEWAGTSDLDEGEGYADRLFALIMGIADADLDGEVGDDEVEVFTMAADAAWDYLASKGVSEEDISALLNDWDNDVGSRVFELVSDKVPSDPEAAASELDEFAFGDGSDESVMDAVYKKKLVVRKGKKVRINKRISGTVRLSAAQKLAVRKMLRKSHSATATMRRAKSNRVRKQAGL